MTDINSQIPGNPAPNPAPAPGQANSPELEYLKTHGEDISDLRADLEGLLTQQPSQTPAPAPAPEPQSRPLLEPEPQPAAPNQSNPYDPGRVLPVTADGQDLSPQPQAKAPEPQPAPPPAPQDKALDPYAPNQLPNRDGTQQNQDDLDESEPGEVVIDQEGRVRDAKTGKYVPHQALHAERLRRQKAEADAEKLRLDTARAEERLNMLTQILEGQQKSLNPPQPEPEPEQEIDPEVDIFAAFKQMQKRNQSLEQMLRETKQQSDQQYRQVQLVERYRHDASRFAAEQKDFGDAYRYLMGARRAELAVLGYTDQNAINAQIAAEERTIAENELKKPDGSPARLMYNLAKAKGYKPKAPDPQPSQDALRQPMGVPQPQAAPAPAPVPAPAPTPAPAAYSTPVPAPAAHQPMAAVDRVQHLQNGVNNNASLSGAGGSSGEGLTVQQLADMSEEDFLNFAGKLGMRKLDRLLKG